MNIFNEFYPNTDPFFDEQILYYQEQLRQLALGFYLLLQFQYLLLFPMRGLGY